MDCFAPDILVPENTNKLADIDSNFYSSNQNNPETNINIAAPNAIYVSRECNEYVNRRRKPKATLIHSHTAW